MNILLAFKAEPDAGMLAEKEWQAAAQGKSGPDISLLRSLLGADEQAAAALLLAQRKNGTPMSLTALSMGDERALHWLRYLMALGFEEAVLLETAADLRFAPEFVARHIAEWQHQNPLDLIITGCQSSEGQNGQTPFLLAEMLGWPCFTQVERFTLDALFITLEQRTEHGLRCCRVRLPAVIAVRQCGEVALPAPALIALRASSSSHTSPPAISGWRIFSVTQPSTLGIQPGRISIQSGFDCATCLSML